MRKKDIFDRLMEVPVLNILEPFYQKNREVLLYLFFGGLTFLISVISYALFERAAGMNELVANVFSWVIAVLFAYITNRTWVFEQVSPDTAGIVRELGKFLSGRIATLVVEEGILLVFITWLGFDSMVIKVAGQIVVIALNYVISKLFVFREAGKKDAGHLSGGAF